jgi:hypothetical protein
MSQPRLTGDHPIMLTYTDHRGLEAAVSIGQGAVIIDGCVFPAHFLEGLAALANGTHGMHNCVWVDCPEHACPYDHSHTSNWCGRATCRVS